MIQHPAKDSHPVWSPDGATLYFYSDRETRSGNYGIWRVRVENGDSPNPELVYASDSLLLLPASASETSLYLEQFDEDITRADELNQSDIWALDLNGEDRKPEPVIATPSREYHPTISPNGKWLSYSSDETGIVETYVKSVSPLGPSMIVSRENANRPAWAPDGSRLYWIRGPRLEYIDWSEDGTAGTDVGHLMDQQFGTYFSREYSQRTYAISQDGRKSLVLAKDAEAVMAEWVASAPPIHLKMITHCFQEFRESSE